MQKLLAFQCSTEIKRPLSLNLAMAALYAIGGWLGLLLAVPPGYATFIWPASGLAVAGVLFYGRGIAPGIFLGSFAVNCVVGGAFSGAAINGTAILIAAAIAAGSTLQAALAACLVIRMFDRPISISRFADIAWITVITGPVGCLIASTVGTATLYFAGLVSGDMLFSNWLTWWMGDTVGVLVFMPIALLNPWRPWTIKWAGKDVAVFSVATLVCLIIPLGVTFYSWAIISDAIYERNQNKFSRLVDDSEQALFHRLDSYKQSLDGGAGLFQASQHVELSEWKTYVEALQIEKTLPGINGIGFIEPVAESELADYPERIRADGVPDLKVHPTGEKFDNFIIKFIEPIEPNRQAVGLNIGFERNRFEAAENARDTGKPTITKRIFLVQDQTRSAGFLLLRPLYQTTVAPLSVEARRAAFRGWIYAPFVAPRFMDGLTASQGTLLDMAVYDGPEADPDQLIYSSAAGEDASDFHPVFTVKRTLRVMEQVWTIEWRSTEAFETSVRSAEPWLVLFGGLALSGLFGALLLSFTKREDSIRRLVAQKTRELAAREQQNRSIVDSAMVAIILLDADGFIISANQAAEDIFRQPASSMNDMSFGELVRDKALFRSLCLTVENDAAAPVVHKKRKPIRTYNKDGLELYLDIQLNSWMSESGDTRFTAIIRNVTAEIEAQTALEEAEQRWSYALEGSDIGVFDINLTSGKSIVSAKWKEMLGFDRDEEIDTQAEWTSRIHPDDRARVAAADEACLTGKAPRSISEYRIRRKDGSWIWMRSDAVVVEHDANGMPSRMIGTQTDTTELKRAEAALKASEERFRSAIEDAPVGMALVTLDRKWIKVNAALCKLLGYSEQEMLGTDPTSMVHPEDMDAGGDRFENLLAGEISTYQREVRFHHKNGSLVWVLLSASMAQDPDNNSRYLIVQFQDITDQKEMERLKTEFVSTVSHELRTPLTSIRASLGLVLGAMAKDLPEGANRLISIAHNNCERLVLLINDILDLEKMSSGHMRLTLSHETLPELLEQTIEANNGFADQFGVKLTLDGSVPACLVNVDQARFHQVLANLISNASKFSPPKGTIRIVAEPIAERVRISVIDKGSGIAPEFHGKIFGRFSQADSSSSRAKGGTGLGLHISKQLIEQMGGAIGFESVVGEGTTFWIELPMEHAPEAFVIGQDGTADDNLPTVLHLEDDRDFCEVVRAYLTSKAKVISTATVHAARDVLDAETVDLAILDDGLYNGSGLELIGDLHAWNIPILVLSARENLPVDDRVELYLSKSRVTESELVRIVMDILEPTDDRSGQKRAHAGGR